MKLRRIVLAIMLIAYLIMWIGGIASYMFLNGPPLDARWTAPAFLLLAGSIVILAVEGRERAALIAAALLGFVAEVIGVRYGIPFGSYRYTETLAPHFLEVPLVMMCAWMVLVGYLRQMMLLLSVPVWLQLVATSLWMTAIDLVIDPLAAGPLGYWRWAQSGSYYGIPAQNFLGWFIVSLVIFATIHFLAKRPKPDGWSRNVGFSIVIFFTLIALAAKLWIAGLAGVALCLVHIVILKRVPKTAGRRYDSEFQL